MHHITSPISPWVTCPTRRPRARLRLLCFPYAGGGASIFRSWPRSLPSDVQVCPIQLPGRESRLLESAFTELSSLTQTLAEVLHPFLDLPFAFFGHSMGALVGFELARQLRRQNSPEPVHLFVSGWRAPQLASKGAITHTLPEPQFLESLQNLNGTPQTVLQNPELMDLLLPILRADFALCENYVYYHEAPLNCPISAFGGIQDRLISHDELAAWRSQTSNSFSFQLFPGDHFFINSNRDSLLQAVADALSQRP